MKEEQAIYCPRCSKAVYLDMCLAKERLVVREYVKYGECCGKFVFEEEVDGKQKDRRPDPTDAA
jgi:hypothetical protein